MVQELISRGFRGRRREDPAVAGRIPPGQYLTHDVPVLSVGPTPRPSLAAWDFTITGDADPSPIGTLMRYGHEMGVILRCPARDTAVPRIARVRDRYWLDPRGAACLQVDAGQA